MKICWKLKIDGISEKDYDVDEIDYICDQIKECILYGEINVDFEKENK